MATIIDFKTRQVVTVQAYEHTEWDDVYLYIHHNAQPWLDDVYAKMTLRGTREAVYPAVLPPDDEIWKVIEETGAYRYSDESITAIITEACPF